MTQQKEDNNLLHHLLKKGGHQHEDGDDHQCIGVVCYLENNNGSRSMFSGLVLLRGQHGSISRYGLYGKEKTGYESGDHSSCCCGDDPPKYFDCKLFDFKKPDAQLDDLVKYTGGDYIHFVSHYLEFTTETLETGEDADAIIKKYINPKLIGKDAIVCIGNCVLNDDFFEKISPPSKEEHEDDDF